MLGAGHEETGSRGLDAHAIVAIVGNGLTAETQPRKLLEGSQLDLQLSLAALWHGQFGVQGDDLLIGGQEVLQAQLRDGDIHGGPRVSHCGQQVKVTITGGKPQRAQRSRVDPVPVAAGARDQVLQLGDQRWSQSLGFQAVFPSSASMTCQARIEFGSSDRFPGRRER